MVPKVWDADADKMTGWHRSTPSLFSLECQQAQRTPN